MGFELVLLGETVRWMTTWPPQPQLRRKLFMEVSTKCFLLKNGPTPASFWFIFVFSKINLHAKYRWQRESNSDRRSRRRARWPPDHYHLMFLLSDEMLLSRMMIRDVELYSKTFKCQIFNRQSLIWTFVGSVRPVLAKFRHFGNI